MILLWAILALMRLSNYTGAANGLKFSGSCVFLKGKYVFFSTRRLAYNSNSPIWPIARIFSKVLKGFDTCVAFNLSYNRVSRTCCGFLSFNHTYIFSNIVLCNSSGCLRTRPAVFQNLALIASMSKTIYFTTGFNRTHE